MAEANTYAELARARFEELGDAENIAHCQRLLGHLASDRFPEAARAGADAEQWFAARGAAHYVKAYRANAVRPAPMMT